MTIKEFLEKIGFDSRVNIEKPMKVYDPVKDDYIEATGFWVAPDGSITLQTPD